MEHRSVKDLSIILTIVMIITFGVLDYFAFAKANKISEDSKYKGVALSKDLLEKIQSIDASIQDRKNFAFTVVKDPLEQNLIVKTQDDLLKIWEKKIASMLRLSSIVEADGEKFAMFDYKGKQQMLRVGEKIADAKIIEINNDSVIINRYGNNVKKVVEPIPPKPAGISKKNKSVQKEYNW